MDQGLSGHVQVPGQMKINYAPSETELAEISARKGITDSDWYLGT